MFDEMAADGIEVGSEMIWGYYFADPNVDKLEAVVPELEEQGFEFVELLETEPEGDEEKFFVLHIERLEIHDVDSLDKLNQQLEDFAIANGLDSYDGMDVTPLDEDEQEEDEEGE